MKSYTVGLALVLLVSSAAAQSTSQTTYCGGAAGNSKACALGCSGTRVNDEVVANSNQGTFDVGNGNQGDGNDGFNNVGNFNIGNGNVGNCNLMSGGNGGSCDPSNDNGQIVIRFCHVYPTNNRCNPGGYLPEFSAALVSQLPAIVSSCNGVQPGAVSAARVAAAAGAAATTPRAAAALAPSAVTPSQPKPTPASSFLPVSDSTADLATLLALFDEHIKQETALGRKLKL